MMPKTGIAPNTRRPSIRVLSLFDGIGSGYVALKELDLAIGDYFASEIDESAIMVARLNSEGKISHIGDIASIDKQKLQKIGRIDLLLGGSPCTELSLVNPSRRGLFDMSGSGTLFFDYIRILKDLQSLNPNILFLFENTAAMPIKFQHTISRFLKCEPILLDSKLFCPMKRARYFWGNIPLMKIVPDIKENNFNHLKYFLTENCGRTPQVSLVRTVTTNSNSLRQGVEKTLPVLMANAEDNLWITEIEKIFGFKEHYTDVGNLSKSKRLFLLGNSWCIHVIRYLLRGLHQEFLLCPSKSKHS